MSETKLYRYNTAVLRFSDRTFHLYISDLELDVVIKDFSRDSVTEGVLTLEQLFVKYVKDNPMADLIPKSLFSHIQHTKQYLRLNGEPIEAYLYNTISELVYTWE